MSNIRDTRFEIIKKNRGFVIIDRKKLPSCITNKRLTNTIFETKEQAEGYIFGMRSLKNAR